MCSGETAAMRRSRDARKQSQTSGAFYCPERCERVSRLRSYRVVGISLGGANHSTLIDDESPGHG
jgi:hypothetical protein